VHIAIWKQQLRSIMYTIISNLQKLPATGQI